MPDDDNLVLDSRPIDLSQSGDNAVAPSGDSGDSDKEDGKSNSDDATQNTSDNDGNVTLTKDNYDRDIALLQNDNPEFANAFNNSVGRKAKMKYDPIIASKDEQIASLNSRLRRSEISSMKPDEIEQKFQTDSQFAQEYASAVHEQPDVSSNRTEAARMQSTLTGIIDNAMTQGLSSAKADEFQEALRTGKYDKDNSGQPLSHWTEGMNLLQQDIYQELRTQSTTSDKTVSNPIDGQSSQDNASPDMSGQSSHAASGRNKWSMEEINQFTPPQHLAAFPNEGDFERAIRAGEISGVSSETKELYS